ncbi:protein GRAVITROPIC IN THE LIGHT 1 [Diospyros lotus]|uniref:protein GRAVITROPIC IN THE LIGHT 1 n=1 Tax=Diospyros lotus TaxID=55363 RepID=UPI0022555838|nr:protein GRAVITROPIC IN THE LIGHT 1 [Diospyros lotus]
MPNKKLTHTFLQSDPRDQSRPPSPPPLPCLSLSLSLNSKHFKGRFLEMPVMDGSAKPPQISEMFQKFALAFKAKTFEFFADEEDSAAACGGIDDGADGFTLLDSAEEFIPDQKVVVIKPDQTHSKSPVSKSASASPLRPTATQLRESVVSSIFATVSSFEASYLQFQTAHAPFDEDAIKAADKALVSHLQRLSDVRNWYRDLRKNSDFNAELSIGSSLEAQVQENQSKLRTLETAFNRLQSEIDEKDDRVSALRQEVDKIHVANSKLSKKLLNSAPKSKATSNSTMEVMLTIRVFDSLLREACRSLHSFTKLLIGLMKKAGWDLDLAANSVHSDIDYAKKGHNRYAFLSYVSLGMFRGFDSERFGLEVSGIVSNGHDLNSGKINYLKQLVEHIACNPMEVLSNNPSCEFSRFCEKKYQQLIHPTMESSIFSNLDENEVVLSSWKSLSAFYESFVKMSSSIWLLHKLAFSFNPGIEIFRVERGVNFSMVYMEDVTKKGVVPGKSRPKVGFTVIPGFKIGETIIQSQVYLIDSLNCTD